LKIPLLSKLKLCVNSQTPFVKFLLSSSELLEKYGRLGNPVKLTDLVENEDYQYSPGGVTAMVYPLLKRMQAKNIIDNPIWVSLGSNAPKQVMVDGIRLFHVHLPESDLERYANFKESIWGEIHQVSKMELKPEDYEAFIRYNWLSAQTMLKMLRDTDLYFIHDFQQLSTGGLIGPSAPAILQWHIPFRLDSVSPKLKSFILKNIEGFDSIIVSTRRDLEGLINAGYRGRAYQIYPYIDRNIWTQPTSEALNKVREVARLTSDDIFLLIVARMDPIKGQDVAIKALSRVSKARPNIKLMMIGNGSFSGSSKGGLAHPKPRMWKELLIRLTKELNLEDKVIFAGYRDTEFVKAAYTLANATIVPSKAEGFALTTIESWMYKNPVIVSSGAGSSELVIDGSNGYSFKTGSDEDLARKIEMTIANTEEARKMGERGLDSTSFCDVDRSMAALGHVFEETLHYFG
jgi:glycosyltransferase involved in cell wall biosynthesis